jgi:hypothetical protein
MSAPAPPSTSLGCKSNQSEVGAASSTQALPVSRRAHPTRTQAPLSPPALSRTQAAHAAGRKDPDMSDPTAIIKPQYPEPANRAPPGQRSSHDEVHDLVPQ